MRSTTTRHKLDTLRSLKDTLSPFDYTFIYISWTLPTVMLLRPSFLEYVVLLLVDILAAMVVIRVEGPVFLRFFPDSALFFPDVDEEKIGRLGTRGKIDLYRAMCRYPIRRAAYVFVMDYPKFIPAWLVVIFW